MTYLRTLVLGSCFAALACVAVGCSAADTAKAKQVAGDAVTKAKDTFLAPMTAKYDEITKKIAELTGDEKEKAQKLFDELKTKVNDLKSASADKWESMKGSIEELYKKLKDMLKLS